MQIMIADIAQGIFGIFGDVCHFIPNCDIIMIGFKIVILLFLIGWVKNHVGGGIIATLVMLFMGYFILFDWFWLFGPLAVIYFLAIVGVTGLMMDFVFTKHYYMPEAGESPQGRMLGNPNQMGPQMAGGMLGARRR